MTEPRFKIVFDGQLMPDTTLESAKDKLAELFKSDRARIDGLFSGAQVVLKRDLSEAQAQKYRDVLQRAGIQIRMESDFASILSLVETDDHQPDEPAAEQRMSCPKCDHEQTKASECVACGIVIEKFVARQAQLPSQLLETPASPASPYATPRSQVGEPLPEFAELKLLGVDGRIGRLRYLAWTLVLTLVCMPLLGIAMGGFAIANAIGVLLVAAVTIGLGVVSVMFGVKRLHDIGWSGWLLLLSFVPLVGSVFALLMLVLPGTPGANRYGPPAPPNSTAVQVLAWLWLGLIVLAFFGAIIAAIALPSVLGQAT